MGVHLGDTLLSHKVRALFFPIFPALNSQMFGGIMLALQQQCVTMSGQTKESLHFEDGRAERDQESESLTVLLSLWTKSWNFQTSCSVKHLNIFFIQASTCPDALLFQPKAFLKDTSLSECLGELGQPQRRTTQTPPRKSLPFSCEEHSQLIASGC